MKTIEFEMSSTKVEQFFFHLLEEANQNMRDFGVALDVEYNNMSPLSQCKWNSINAAYLSARRQVRSIMRLWNIYLSDRKFSDDEIKELNKLGYNFKFVTNDRTGKVEYISLTDSGD